MATSGIIFDIKKYAIHDGPGIRTTLFFKGCPMNCWWCHNPEGIKCEPETLAVKPGGNGLDSPENVKKEAVGRIVDVEEMMAEIKKDTIFYDQSGGGVTFSGGEPMMQLEFLIILLQSCKDSSINTALDTSGYASSEDLENVCGLADLILYDLKLMDDTAHIKYTGVSNKLILDNLRMLSENGSNINVRIPMIPGITDTDDNLDAMAGFLSGLKNIQMISFLPYNRFCEDKLRRFNMVNRLGSLKVQTRAEMDDKAERFRSFGYEVKIGG